MDVRVAEGESKTICSRRRPDGSRITYVLNVLQQPERARACGQGAKAQTDRRPVDPPPIIDLSILLGEEGQEQDITQSYSPSFFLWASLEHARLQAHGRVPQNAISNPVLTGQIVAGASLLERPRLANYFIFPDLSVRHEGLYKLSFNLYENAPDNDTDVQDGVPGQPSLPGQGFQICRSSVKSEPFQVFSAKKFPGLNESTHLSRVVADQGCRVRIRRDVRMRKRDARDAKDWDDYEDKTAEQRAKASATPELHHVAPPVSAPPSADPMRRPRSLSATSSVSAYHHHMPEHRKSTSDLNQQYQQGYAQPHPPPPSHPFTYPQSSVYDQHPQYPSQYQQHSPVAHLPHQPSPYHNSPYHYQPQHSIPQSSGYGGYMHQQPPPPPSPYEQQAAHYIPPPPPPGPYAHSGQPAPLGPLDNTYNRPTNLHQPPSTYQHSTSVPMPATSHSGRLGKDLPPLTTSEMQNSRMEPVPMALVPSSTLQRTNSFPHLDSIRPPPPPPQYVSQAPSSAMAQKRVFGAVFNTSHLDQPLRAGARPSTETKPYIHPNAMAAVDSDEDDEDVDSALLRYRRADGSYRYLTSPKIP